jgi:DNA polymerase (family X)
MDRYTAALVLSEIGVLLELQGENRFRARAFRTAARALDGAGDALERLVQDGELERLPGLGPATAQVVRELLATGASSLHHELRQRTPPGFFELLSVPGLGAQRIRTLHQELGIDSVAALDEAARAGRVAELPGFGARTQARILEGLAFHQSTAGQRLQPDALAVAEWVAGFLESRPGVERVVLAGEVRRRLETVAAVDLLAVVGAGGTAAVLDAFAELPGAGPGERSGADAARTRLADGVELRLRCVGPAAFAAAWVHATGSDAHLAALAARAAELGLWLDGDGLWRGEEPVPLADEAALYAALGLAPTPPELREEGTELAEAAAGAPPLVAYDDLRGCFHCHTDYSDGKATLTEMAEAALARGWRYLGVADHSRTASYAGGLEVADIARQHEEIDAWNGERGGALWIFKGIEADILPDGRLDYAEEGPDFLGRFDYVVASIHSAFGLPRDEQTARVLRALDDPHVTFLGHPTGRLLLSRPSYAIDLERVIEAAAERGVGIEINANPRRMELDWRHWRRARQLGVRTAINPDAHSVRELGLVAYGLSVARKGGLGPDHVVNSWPLNEVRRYFESRRR